MLKNYVYAGELGYLANPKNPMEIYLYLMKIREKFPDNEDIVIKLEGSAFLKKDAIRYLPQKYHEAARQCTDLTNMLPARYAAKILDMGKNYFSRAVYGYTEHREWSDFQPYRDWGIVKGFKRIKKKIFVLFDENFMREITEKNRVPFRIRDKEDEKMAEKIFRLNKTKIGVYA